MAHIPGHDRSQMLLLPETVDDYVGPDHPVRFIEAFVDGLDLEAAGFARVEPKPTGRPGYAPADLLKLPGFKWSSQHLERGGCDDCSEAAFGSVRARRVALAWSALCCAA
jgi:hypothetical protein